MRRHTVMALLLSLIMLLGCSHATGEKKEPDHPPFVREHTIIRLARNQSGHIFNAIADQQGYLKDEGITVVYVPVSTDAEVFEGMRTGLIDIASNSGTNLPLQHIAEGMDLTIFGGYLLTGCMPLISKVDTPWNGIQTLIGKTVACEPNVYPITGPLLDRGYNPLKQVNWLETNSQEERIEAVLNGNADFALVGTPLNYEVITNPEIKIVTYAADLLPAYSCCRVEARTGWLESNPNTCKALLRAWIRAMAYYDSHHDETVALVADFLHEDEAFVRAYLDNPRCELNIDPMKKSVERAWDYMDQLGLLSEEAKQINIDDHINIELYKAALDECQEKYGAENPKFYEKLQAQFAKNNQ